MWGTTRDKKLLLCKIYERGGLALAAYQPRDIVRNNNKKYTITHTSSGLTVGRTNNKRRGIKALCRLLTAADFNKTAAELQVNYGINKALRSLVQSVS